MDFALLHALGAAISLLLAATLGLVLLVVPASELTLRIATVYGVFGLLGFLAQMVVAMEARLIPLYAWYRAHAATGFRGPVRSPHLMRDRRLQAIVFAAWTFAVPSIATGFFLDAVLLLGVGAWVLLVAVLVAVIDNAFALHRAFAPAQTSFSDIGRPIRRRGLSAVQMRGESDHCSASRS